MNRLLLSFVLLFTAFFSSQIFAAETFHGFTAQELRELTQQKYHSLDQAKKDQLIQLSNDALNNQYFSDAYDLIANNVQELIENDADGFDFTITYSGSHKSKNQMTLENTVPYLLGGIVYGGTKAFAGAF